ncbi:FMN-binding protein [bacterium]|nr:FMN-binding protein [bacterium]RQV98305.1 MAG: FMN-binding protein [bacterium]
MNKKWFAIFFMILVTAFFITILSTVHEISKDRIQEKEQIQFYRSISYASRIFPEDIKEENLPASSTTADIDWNEENLLEIFQNRIRFVRLPIVSSTKQLLETRGSFTSDSADIFIVLNENGEREGYGFPLRGKGLWGTIRAIAVVSSDLTRMVGIDFTEQSETPGLGARIMESGFKYHFRGLDLSGFLGEHPEEKPIEMVARKETSNLAYSTNRVEAITGATQTCLGILKMLNTDLPFYLDVIQENERLIKTID